MLKGKLAELGHSGHRAILVHDLADNSGRTKPGQPRQVHSSFCLPGASQDSGVPRTKWKYVAGANQIGRLGRGINGCEHRGRTIRGRDSGSRPLPRLNADAKSGLESRPIVRHHERNFEFIEALGRHRQANQTTAILRHEVDGLRV